MAELIKMSVGTWTQVGPRNHVSDGAQDLPMRWGIFEDGPLQSIRTPCRELCKNG